MTDHLPALRSRAGELATEFRDPREDWPDEAVALAAELAALFGDDDPLPAIGGAWVAASRSRHTRRSRRTGLLLWSTYCRTSGNHPLTARRPLADAYARWLETQTVARGKRKGEPLGDAARAQRLATAGGFYKYALDVEAAERNPFSGVQRPEVDPDESPTEGLLPEETERLLTAARDRSPRAAAIVLLLYLVGMRIDELLALQVEDLGYDRGHRTLPLRLKGGRIKRVPIAPPAVHALDVYLAGRTSGHLIATRTGHHMYEADVWRLLRSLARKAGIPQADSIKPHTMRHGFITDSLDAGVPLQDVQDAVGHRNPRTTQRYNRRRRRLESHPGYALARTLQPEPEETAE